MFLCPSNRAYKFTRNAKQHYFTKPIIRHDLLPHRTNEITTNSSKLFTLTHKLHSTVHHPIPKIRPINICIHMNIFITSLGDLRANTFCIARQPPPHKQSEAFSSLPYYLSRVQHGRVNEMRDPDHHEKISFYLSFSFTPS
ncbi:hypothetical protein CDAR_433101 [Caerostris darwini]|uniref:Uncharacterized protein n=1 Tax=Caerostris darwini TaxID=1538125 RepID=A0AAV4QJS2_9ARAC|nr:hypothetical protein CDAR_433101 [Caerostris darwini]